MLAETTKSVKSDKAATTDRLMDVLPGTSKSCKNTGCELRTVYGFEEIDEADVVSSRSIESFVCRICHNNENPERLISPCLCKGSLTYVHCYCLEKWIGISRCTSCELCHFQYNIEQTLRYNFYQSLRIWYSRPMSRRALQEDCQMFLLLTLIAFGIIGTLLVAVQFYILQGHISGLGRIWTKGWLIFFLLTTLIVYIINAYLVIKAQLLPWYRWWQTARDVRLVLQNHNPPYTSLKEIKTYQNSTDEPVSWTGGNDSPQQNVETALRNDESQQKPQRADAKPDASPKKVCKPSEILFDSNNHNIEWYLMNEMPKNKLRLHLFENSGASGVEMGMPLVHPPNSLVTEA